MTGLAEPGLAIWMAHRPDPRRKLAYSWTVVEAATGALVGVDTGVPNRLVGDALARRSLPEFAAYSQALKEQYYGEGSRVDFLLKGPALPDLYLEIKSVTLSRVPGLAEFPDARTAQGRPASRRTGSGCGLRCARGGAICGAAGRLQPVFSRSGHRSDLCGGFGRGSVGRSGNALPVLQGSPGLGCAG